MTDQYILDKIKELMPDEHHVPRGVLYSKLKTSVQADLSALMRKLCKEKKILANRTLNDIILNINEQKEH